MEKAQATIHAYDAKTCGTEGPPAADVAFKADGSSKPYCKALGRFNGKFEQVASSQFDPAVLRTVVTADSFSGTLDALDRSAPVGIAADQKAVSEWFHTRWSDVIAEFDYDLRGVWLDGTPEDRAVFHLAQPRRRQARLPPDGLRRADLYEQVGTRHEGLTIAYRKRTRASRWTVHAARMERCTSPVSLSSRRARPRGRSAACSAAARWLRVCR